MLKHLPLTAIKEQDAINLYVVKNSAGLLVSAADSWCDESDAETPGLPGGWNTWLLNEPMKW